jgi:hypothetical protein
MAQFFRMVGRRAKPGRNTTSPPRTREGGLVVGTRKTTPDVPAASQQ